MSNPQDQYRDYVAQNQQAVASAMDTWTKTVEQSVGALPTNPAQLDPQQVVDQVFDFAERMLHLQRDLTTNLLTSSRTLSTQVTGQPAPDGAAASSAADQA